MTTGIGGGAQARADLQAYVGELAQALVPHASPGGARIRPGLNIAHHDDAAADLEGYARPLWGLAPLAAGGGDFAHWDLWARGLAAGTDPAHPEYWGDIGDLDQRQVETAAIGFALALAPERFWDPLDGKERDRVGRWLAGSLDRATPPNNWNFFPVLVSLGLDRVGHAHDRDARNARLDTLESYALGDGWYGDGATPQRDYYVPWAMHFYGLVHAALAGDQDPARAERFRQRAAAFAGDFRHWFADDGSAVPFGRSLTYRFAQGSFWGALPYAGVDTPSHGEVKGLLLRHLRWWRARQADTATDGVLSIGYAYPQPLMAEQYNSPGSPYWAMKAFLPLALPAAHPFWTAPEEPHPAAAPAEAADPPGSGISVQPHAGAVVMRSGGDVTLLSGLQHGTWPRGGSAKYAKFAYSTRFGFSVPAGELGLIHGAYDSMLAVSDDDPAAEPVHFRVREASEEPRTTDDGTVCATWHPWPDVEITTWVTAAAPWHLRTHRIRTARPLHTAEGGFAVDRDGGLARREEADGSAVAVSAAGDLSGLRDAGDGAARAGRVIEVLPGTNLLARRTVLPTLTAQLAPGEHWLRCAVLGAGPARAAAWDGPVPPPTV
ncbi:hypothetical protein SAMN05216223_101707 [Actinacidiphila yanglinensis]|uniref:DUF2264 domain-containing protein n=1 Tax=Actinacidiphila yanglinensis TaxID=310779 RepID=A0A1H5U1E2_9ACTN|nr:DUF2264 domain-containing protein [Actinacidiphila yanglinensis]SEF68097.1 hypothetical protein SAMN05216223_101707 [Actinacidiphila yanglinensis]